jgi:hypothetical protein
MEKGRQSFTDMFFVDGDQLNDKAVDETVTEGHSGAQDVTTQPEDITPEAEEVTEVTTQTGDTEEDAESENGDGKQAEEVMETSSEVSEEDALSNDSDNVDHIDGAESIINELVTDENIYFDEEKEYDMTVDGLKEIINENVQLARDTAIDHLKKGLDDQGQQILDIIQSGGSVQEFLERPETIDFKSIKVLNEDGSVNVETSSDLIGTWMELQDYTEEEINERLDVLDKAGLLRKEAERAKAKLDQKQTKDISDQKKLNEQNAALAQEEARERAEAFREDMVGTTDIAGFKVSKTEAQKLYDFVSKPDKDGKTAFEKADTDEARKLYAYFAMNNFDVDALSREVATKNVRTIKKRISNANDGQVRPGGQTVRRGSGENGLGDISWLGM